MISQRLAQIPQKKKRPPHPQGKKGKQLGRAPPPKSQKDTPSLKQKTFRRKPLEKKEGVSADQKH